MDGYFIRRGDKTSCGGEVTGSDSLITIMGIEHAREGDSVTCGVTGLTYQIQGGVSYITSSGLRVAGTLDSVSGCPCKASLYHTWNGSTYEKEGTSTGRTAAPPTASQSGSASTRAAPAGFVPGTAPSEQEDCSGCFQLMNQRYLPCEQHRYALLQSDELVAESHLNEEGFSNIGTSSKPIRTQLALSAPAPVME